MSALWTILLTIKITIKDGCQKSSEKGWLTFEEAMESHGDFDSLTSEEVSNVVLYTLWAFNDIYRSGRTPTAEQFETLKNYIYPLLVESNGTLFQEHLLNAEVYRELGCFEECLKTLKNFTDDDDFVKYIANEVKRRAENKDTQVFKTQHKSKILT